MNCVTEYYYGTHVLISPFTIENTTLVAEENFVSLVLLFYAVLIVRPFELLHTS